MAVFQEKFDVNQLVKKLHLWYPEVHRECTEFSDSCNCAAS